MPPLPPIPLERYRAWATDKWSQATQAVIDAIPAGNWALEAERSIAGLGDAVRGLQPPPPPPAPPPAPPPVSMTLPEEAPSAFAPTPPPPPASPPVLGGLQDLGQRVTSGLGDLNARAAGALGQLEQGAGYAQQTVAQRGQEAGDWWDDATRQIEALGSGLGASAADVAGQVAGGFEQAQAAPLPTLEQESTWEPATPWEQAGAMASRVPRGAVEPVQDVIGRVQRASAGASGGLQGLGLPEGVSDVAGFGAGALALPGAVMGGSVQSAAERAGVPEAQLQGDIADILAPVPGTRFGNLTRLRTAGLVGGPVVGGALGALTAQGEAGLPPDADDRLRAALKGAALGAQLGPDAVDLLARVPYRFGEYAEASRRLGVTPGAGFSDVTRATEAVPQDVLRAQAEAQLAARNARGNAVDSAAERANLRAQRAAQEARNAELAGVAPPGGAAATTSGIPAQAAQAPQEAARRILLPSERQALRDAIASGRQPPPEVVQAVQRAQGDDAGRVLAEVLEAAEGAPATADRVTLLENLLTTAMSNRLSGLRGLYTNFIGGLQQTGGRLAEETASLGPGAAGADLAAMRRAVLPALGDAAATFRRGGTPEALAQAAAEGRRAGGWETGEGLARTAATAGLRANVATDAFWQALNRSGTRAAGEAAGLPEEQILARMEEARRHVGLVGQGSALSDALVNTRKGLASPAWGDKAQALVAAAYASFVRVPGRILNLGIRGALGPVTYIPEFARAARRGDRVAMREVGTRAAASTLLTTWFGALAANGELTDEGPRDPQERRRKLAEVDANGDPLWRPNALRVPWVDPRDPDSVRHAWVDGGFFGAVGQQMGIVANTVNAWKAQAAAGKDPAQAVMRGDFGPVADVGGDTLKWIFDESYLSDVGRLVTAITQGKGVEQFAGQMAELGSSLAPTTQLRNVEDVADLGHDVLLRAGIQTPEVRDPYERETRGTADFIRAGVPGLRRTLPARIDPTTGEPLRRADSPLAPLPGDNRVAAEIARLEAQQRPNDPTFAGISPRTFDDRELRYAGAVQDDAARGVLRRAYGSEANRYLREAIASRAYQSARSDAEKAAMLKDALATAERVADVRAGARVARSPQKQADYEYLAVPQYEGAPRTENPDDVRLYNLSVKEAQDQLRRWRARYPGRPEQGERAFREAAPEQYRLSQRSRRPQSALERERDRLEDRLSVRPAEEAAVPSLAGTVRP